MLKTDPSQPVLDIVVSGSHGLVGSALCQRLKAGGHRVRGLSRSTAYNGQKRDQADQPIGWDPKRGLHDPNQISGADCVIHLAGHSIGAKRWTASEKQLIRDSRVAATRRLVEQMCQLASPPAAFIGASAVGYYGDCGDESVDEQTPPADSFLGNVARDWEEASAPLLDRGVRVAHGRLGIVLDSRGGALGKILPLFRGYLGGPLGSGDQYWSWISLDDCTAAFAWLIEQSQAQGAYNLVAPQPVTNAQFTAALAAALHVPARLPAPSALLRLVAGEMADALLLCSCRAIPARLQQAGFVFEQPALSPFLQHELSRPQ
jgi:uncharacterized protein (TIGR01777 family)